MALTKATLIDLNSNELVLDLDADTSITADTDDTIHIKIAGSDELTLTTTAIAPSTSDGQALGTTSLMFSDLFLASASVINFNNGDVTLTHGSNLLTLDGGALDLDGEDLILDPDADTKISASQDDTIEFSIAGTGVGNFTNSSSSFVITSGVQDADIIFKGYDSSSLITPLTLDMSDAGALLLTGGKIDLKNAGTRSKILFYCESSNAHAQTLQAAPHSESASNTLTLPSTGGDVDLVSTASTATLTNKTLTTPVIAEIDSGSTITLDATTDIILDADGADIILKDGGTTFATFTNSSTDFLIESAVSDKDIIFKVNDGGSSTEVARFDGDVSSFKMASGKKIMLGAAEETISGDGTDITFEVGSSGDINIPANIGLTFGNDGEKIEGDGTDLTVSGNNINLTATADVVIPANVGITFGTGEKIEGDSTDLTITSGADINLTATADVNIPSGVGITFGDDGEKIEGDGTDLTIASSAKLNLTATSDVHIPNNVGIVFGGDSEKIEGDGTDMTISANNLTVDAAADITLDAAGNDLNFAAGGTTVLTVTNSSSDVIIKPIVDTKDLIFQQRDGTEVFRVEDGAYASFAAAAVNPEATLTDASTVSWNVLTSPVAKVTLGANRTLGAGSGAITGQFVSLLVIQDGTGSRTLSYNAVYEFKDDTAPTLTTTAAKGDLFVFRYNGSKFLEVGRNQNLTLS